MPPDTYGEGLLGRIDDLEAELQRIALGSHKEEG